MTGSLQNVIIQMYVVFFEKLTATFSKTHENTFAVVFVCIC